MSSTIINEVRKGLYLDSVALMRIAQSVKAISGIEECGLMMGTPANRRIMAEAGVLGAEGTAAGAGDLVIAIKAADTEAAETGLLAARRLLDQPAASQPGKIGTYLPKSLRAARARSPEANLALISVPGAFAYAEAMKAISCGLNVLLFSDNVPLDEEIALKRAASEKGLLMMGPDCGTAIIGGVPLAFANVVRRGDTGVVGASGTGIQEVTSLISNGGGGISHAIGTGGRDLKREVGATTMLAGIDLLDDDPMTRQIVLISKPPDKGVVSRVLERVAASRKRFVVCFVGGGDHELPQNACFAATLEDAAFAALGLRGPHAPSTALPARVGYIRGLYSGGTLAAEAQVVLRRAGLAVASNAPTEGATAIGPGYRGHAIIDLGDDAYTVGRPHPMIEPGVRDAPLAEALSDETCGVVLLDCVLGHGSAGDPAGQLAVVLAGRAKDGPHIVASVTGTDADPQCRAVQVARLREAGVEVASSNAAAAAVAVRLVANNA